MKSVLSPTADPGDASFYGHSSPSVDSRRVVVSYKRKYVHETLVNRLVKPVQEKCGYVN